MHYTAVFTVANIYSFHILLFFFFQNIVCEFSLLLFSTHTLCFSAKSKKIMFVHVTLVHILQSKNVVRLSKVYGLVNTREQRGVLPNGCSRICQRILLAPVSVH